jgi:hypothetical protein
MRVVLTLPLGDRALLGNRSNCKGETEEEEGFGVDPYHNSLRAPDFS